MDKIRRKLNNLSIPSTFVLLAGAFLLIAMLLVEIEKTLLMNAQQESISYRYIMFPSWPDSRKTD